MATSAADCAGWPAGARWRRCVVFGVGLALERLWLGPTDQTALAHVAADTQDEFARTHAQPGDDRAAAGARPAADRRRPRRRRRARARLFDLAARLLAASRPALDAVSVYDSAGRPVAWAGRPSTPPARSADGAVRRVCRARLAGLARRARRAGHGRRATRARRVGAVVTEAILPRNGRAARSWRVANLRVGTGPAHTARGLRRRRRDAVALCLRAGHHQRHAAAHGTGAATRAGRPARGLARARPGTRAPGAGGDADPARAGPARRAGTRAPRWPLRGAPAGDRGAARVVRARWWPGRFRPSWHWSPPPAGLDCRRGSARRRTGSPRHCWRWPWSRCCSTWSRARGWRDAPAPRRADRAAAGVLAGAGCGGRTGRARAGCAHRPAARHRPGARTCTG